ncbi:hypothetical protein [Paraburkholderia tropica]|uniref:hypothetical protein n=1 Tax=Paraburkholderia tropica TaxID=92647 RepID=UPI002AB63452|nr:hypothetical protein [Paraburkholderia tropica]
MLSARDAAGNEITTERRALGEGVEPFSCIGCGNGVSFVAAFPRELDGKPHTVKAFFRLRPKTEHKENCVYLVDKKVAVLASKSVGLVESLKNGQYRFRLVTIDREPDDKVHTAPAPKIKPGGKEGRPSPQFEPSKSRRLAAYLSTAKRVARLRAACESDESIKDHLQLVFSNEVVSWNDFYYESERFLAAFAWVGNVANSFPIALQGRVRNVVTRSTAKGVFHVLNLKSVKAIPLSSDPTIGESGEASVWSRQAEWLNRFQEDDEVLAFGHWKQARQKPVRLPTSVASFKGFLNREISMWLVFSTQIAKLSEID